MNYWFYGIFLGWDFRATSLPTILRLFYPDNLALSMFAVGWINLDRYPISRMVVSAYMFGNEEKKHSHILLSLRHVL